MMNAPTRFGGGKLHLLYEEHQEELPETPEEPARGGDRWGLVLALSLLGALVAVLVGLSIEAYIL